MRIRARSGGKRRPKLAQAAWVTLFLIAIAIGSSQIVLGADRTHSDIAHDIASPLAAFGADPRVTNAEQWRNRRAPLLRAAFQARIYGWLPPPPSVGLASTQYIDPRAFAGAAQIEATTLRLGIGTKSVTLTTIVFIPITVHDGGSPIIIIPNYCGNEAALGFRDHNLSETVWLPERCHTWAGREIARIVHGENIIRPPFEQLLRAGYAVITYYPGEIAPDDPKLARSAIALLGSPAGRPKTGAIGAWAWSISRIVDYIATDRRFDSSRIAIFGHSRYGKAALLAAALDERIALVIANESGRFGAAPTHSRVGESVASLTEHFPHWFTVDARNAESDHDLDQQSLLGLIAPRPVLLGGATQDSWSDPTGAFRAGQAASNVYRLFGSEGMRQSTPSSADFDADMASFMRSGRHGIARADWTAAIAFLDHHWAARPEHAFEHLSQRAARPL